MKPLRVAEQPKNVTVMLPTNLGNLSNLSNSNLLYQTNSSITVCYNCSASGSNYWSNKLGGPDTKISPKNITVSCTGNTCRSALYYSEASARNLPFETCGTNPDGVYGTPTPALIAGLERLENNPNATDIQRVLLLDGRRDRQAVPCDCGKLVNKGRPFFVVANPSNKQHLLDRALQCGGEELARDIDRRVFISWEVSPQCNIMKEYPLYKTIKALLPGKQGGLTEKQAEEEDQAYDALINNMGKCVVAVSNLKAKELDRARALELKRLKL